jgi:RNA polymerase sigma-70 factor (ECF subfamily)
MEQTSASLLEQVRNPADQEAWNRFVVLYTPLLYQWARGAGLQPSDAADLVQDVFIVLVRKLPDFRYDPHGSFRAWLKTVTLNKWRETQRARAARPHAGDGFLSQLAGPDCFGPFWEAEYHQHVVAQALRVMQTDFQPVTWRAFWEHVIAGRPVPEVASELGISTDSVYSAKSRVLRRLRQELQGLLD